MFKKWIILLFTTVFVLSACHSQLYNQTQGNVADAKIKVNEDLKKSDNDAKPTPPLVVKNGLYVDTTPQALSRDPSWMQNHIVLNGDKLPFSYFSRAIASGAGVNTLTKYQMGLDSAVKISMNYSGSIKGALDMLASKAGYVYNVRNKQIYWQSVISKTFDVAFMPGGTDYMMGKTSSSAAASSGGGGTVSDYSTGGTSQYSNLKGTLSVWDDLGTTIKQLLTPTGTVVVSQSTTSVTVNDKPSNVELVGQYIANMNRNLAKQVLVKVQVMEVNLETGYDFGINWQLIANAFHNSPFVVNGNYGTPVSITALTSQVASAIPQMGLNSAQDPDHPNGVPSYTILFNALSQQGKTAIVTEPRVVCLNNQVSVIQITESNGYVASIQNTTVAAGGTAPTSTVTSQVTPGTLVTGLTLYILPKILGEKVFLQVNADLSTNDQFTQFGPTNSQIQLPNVTQKQFNQRSVIKSGDTLILSGFRQLVNRTGANQFINSQALGGKAATQRSRETIVLITPIVLHGTV